MSERYIVNGKVARDKIAMDIKYRVINRNKVEQLCDDPQIKAAFKGTVYSDKRPKQEWNKDYLHRLSYAVVAEGFNRDYLLYLDDVANYVSQKAKIKKIVIGGVIIVLVIVAGIIIHKYIVVKSATEAAALVIKALANANVVDGTVVASVTSSNAII